MRHTNPWFFLALAALFLSPLSKAWAIGECEPWVAQVVSVEGRVEAKRAGQVLWKPVAFQETFCAEDTIRVEAHGRTAIVLRNETILRLDQLTAITFSEIDEKEPSWLDLIKGAVHFLSRVPRTLKIRTAFVNAAIEGTEFAIRVEPQQATLWVFEGRVLASNEAGSLTLMSGQAAIAKVGQAPVPHIVVRPRDAVQWALYYPSIIDYRAAAYPPDLGVPAIQEALARYQVGDLQGAFSRLETVPADLRGARYYMFRAGLLLSVGRVDEARTDIEQILRLDPNHANAFALQTIIAVVQNEEERALTLAQRAAELAPHSPIPQVALSYAYQARFEIEKALDTAQEAVNLDPANALAWARLAELWLAVGNLDRAVKAAQESVRRNPGLARTQTVLGFAYLTRIETKQARAAFEKAIVLDQADPLPRLGLGLAKIRQSNLHEGRREMEIAAVLDPNTSLIRSYLGKAYFEEMRAELAGTEFAIAKELDPKDPTPWFYDAIRKQTENRSVSAVQDLQRSIAINDNRAVYRSRLLLDDDLAARAVSLGRIYDDLGFEQLAVNQSTKSLNFDPSNHSAHRFLSDSYSERPRHETARVSELLQAQLLQPISLNPVQPESSETELNLLAGTSPAGASFNEFTPLFERERIRVVASGSIGNNNTLGDQAVAAGVLGRFSYSLGQFHYETDGFRKNNELSHDLYNLFAQAAVTHQLDVQVEYRRRETDAGDLRLNFDPDEFSRIENRRIEQDTPRLGMHFAPGPQSDLIVSFIYGDREEEAASDTRAGPIISTIIQEDHGYDLQAQYIYRTEQFNFLLGGGTYDIEGERRTQLNRDDPSRALLLRSKEDLTGEQDEAYLYANLHLPKNLLWTAGFSYVSFKDGQDGIVDFDRFNPKFGLQGDITDKVRLRLAALRTVKRSLIFDQTLEPTQLAGFNQFFDDFNGTRADRYGIGLDIDLTKDLYGGVELSRRDLEVPRTIGRFAFTVPPRAIVIPKVKFEDQREDLYRAYLYWTPAPDWTVATEYRFERLQRDPAILDNTVAFENFPTEVETMTVPVTVRYFAATGLFAHIGATYVRQELDLAPVSTFAVDQEDFTVVDASIGYRLPRRRGIISFDVKNLFDKDFLFQDSNLQETSPTVAPFIPERTFLARVTFSF